MTTHEKNDETIVKNENLLEDSQNDSTATTAQIDFFNQTYYLFLVLFLIHVFFSLFMFSKMSTIEKKLASNTQALTPSGAPAQPQPTQAPKINLNVEKPSSTDNWEGSQDAKIVLISYFDYECPFCHRVYPTLKELVQTDNEVAFVIRNLPLSFHPKAQKYSESVECASKQGANFFSLWSDELIKSQPELVNLSQSASKIGLDAISFQSCLDTNATVEKIKKDSDSAGKLGINGTPAVIVYNMATGKNILIEGAYPISEFKAKIAEMKK